MIHYLNVKVKKYIQCVISISVEPDKKELFIHISDKIIQVTLLTIKLIKYIFIPESKH